MKDLRERCAKIIMSWELKFGKQLNQKRKVNDLEAFAREIQAEALEEAANRAGSYEVAQNIRALKDTATLAANGEGVAND